MRKNKINFSARIPLPARKPLSAPIPITCARVYFAGKDQEKSKLFCKDTKWIPQINDIDVESFLIQLKNNIMTLKF